MTDVTDMTKDEFIHKQQMEIKRLSAKLNSIFFFYCSWKNADNKDYPTIDIERKRNSECWKLIKSIFEND